MAGSFILTFEEEGMHIFSMEIDIGANDNMHALISQLPIPIDVEDKQDRIWFNQEGTDSQEIHWANSWSTEANHILK